jgi:hypothetical protein
VWRALAPRENALARGSEQISSRWIEGAKRECVKCGVQITNLAKQVGEVRSRYPGPVREIICMSCHMKRKRPAQGPFLTDENQPPSS